MIRRNLLLCSFILFQLGASAQVNRTIYQTFELDSAKTIILDMVGFTDPVPTPWAGNQMLTEVSVQIWDVKPEIVDYFIKKERYAFDRETNGDSLRIFTKVRKRSDIKMPGMSDKSLEKTTVKVFIPEIYQWDPEEWKSENADQQKTLRLKM